MALLVSLSESGSTEAKDMNSPVAKESAARLTSLDVYRGLTMLFMASEIIRIPEVTATFTDSRFWQFVTDQLSHKQWVGCSAWDLIQPSFTFMVGVALPFSYASRKAKGQSFGKMLLHVIYRSLALTFLGVFLRSDSRTQTYFTFEDVLSQIGLGYTFLFLLCRVRPKTQLIAALLILVGYWAAFALYPAPGPGFDYQSVGVPPDWPHHQTGFAAHWDKNTNFAAAFDQWFLNLFPREKPFVFNGGGYLTLSFIPSLATMIFGLLSGGLLRSQRPGIRKVQILLVCGLLGLVLGALLHVLGICPIVKRIWTPSWTIFSTGWTCLLLAGFYWVIDLKGYKRWAFPALVVGMNSITMYCLVHLMDRFIAHSLKIHLGQQVFEVFGQTYEPILQGTAVLLTLWLICFWMYKRKIFLRI
jgi:heparan-alpha-glucosaminide N-acetyltransferase